MGISIENALKTSDSIAHNRIRGDINGALAVSMKSIDKILNYAAKHPEKSEDELTAILITTTVRLVINHHRGESRHSQIDTELSDEYLEDKATLPLRPTEDEAIDSVTEIEKVRLARDIWEFIETRSETSPIQYQVVLALANNTNNMTKANLAHSIGMSPGQFKSALFRLKQDIKESFGNQADGLFE